MILCIFNGGFVI